MSFEAKTNGLSLFSASFHVSFEIVQSEMST